LVVSRCLVLGGVGLGIMWLVLFWCGCGCCMDEVGDAKAPRKRLSRLEVLVVEVGGCASGVTTTCCCCCCCCCSGKNCALLFAMLEACCC